MKNFFYADHFCSDIDDFVEIFDIDENNVSELSKDWHVHVELSNLESIFNIDAESLCQLLAQANEDRLSEDFEEEARVLNALKQSIDFDKLKELLPKLYYPNNKFKVISKSDLIEWFLD